MAFFPCWTHEHHTAPTAILQLEAQRIPGIINYGAVLCYLPLFAYLCAVGDNLQHFAFRYSTRCPSGIGAGWKKGWKWISTSEGCPCFCPLNYCSVPGRIRGSLERCEDVCWASVPDSRWEADMLFPQTTSKRKKLLGMHKGRDLNLWESLSEFIMRK